MLLTSVLLPTVDASSERRVAVAGATGLIGSHLLQLLCRDPGVAAVHALARRPPDFTNPKLSVHVIDFTAPLKLPPLDEIYLALGTTIKAAGSRAAFRAIDLDANLAVARAAQEAGATRVGLVSALGAHPASRIFYNRIKGELEQTLATLTFETLVIARPSLLRGDRTALGQSRRPGEEWANRFDACLRPLIPRRWRAIDSADVAAALAWAVRRSRGRVILLSEAMQGAGCRGGF